MDALAQIIALRKRHRIQPIGGQGESVCAHDAVRVYPTKVGWRHDTAEVVRVNNEVFAVATPRQVR